MRTAIGVILVLIGGGVVVYGLLGAISDLRELYQSATDNAMGMKPTAEQDASKAMIRSAIIGACGLPFLVAGSVMLKLTVFQRLMGGKAGRRGKVAAPRSRSGL